MIPTSTVEFADDPIVGEDLARHGPTSQPMCPYCMNLVTDHPSEESENEDNFNHGHRTIGESQVCRRVYQCGYAQPTNGEAVMLFYVYHDLGNMSNFAVAKVREITSETIDDSDVIKFGRKKLRADIKPKWRFRTKDATESDLTEYFRDNVVVGIELELDFKPNRPISDSQLLRLFGTEHTEYHHLPACPSCGRAECWSHLPDNLIRAIERDASIEGWEFIVYGGRLAPEEFARRLPLNKMAAHFKPTWRNSIHSHAMLVHNIAKVPQVIIKNAWQLFRFYYPGWVYLFGNFSREQGFLRSQPASSDYVPFKLFNKSPFSTRWIRDVSYATHKQNGGGMYFGKFGEAGAARLAELNKPELTKFDIEIRTSDSTTDMEQIVGLRGLTKGMVVRSAQLSNFGLISVETDKETWEKVKAVTQKLNARSGLTEEDEAFMKAQAIAFVKELAPFLSEYERMCLKSLIEKPVRTRSEQEQAKVFNVKTSPLAKDMRRLIALGEVEADTESAWIQKVADLIDSTTADVQDAVNDLKAYFDKELRRMVQA